MAQPGGRARKPPRRRPSAIWVVAAFVAGGLAAILAGSLIFRHPEPSHPAPVSPPGTFRPTDQQWAALTFAPARPAAFRDEIQTDGKISVSDTRTTQVFAPVSGRIALVLVQPGQVVRAGQPLAELDGVEFAQASGDLAAAKAQASAARASEARIGQLYRDQGASLKDWQQAQSDLAAAENALQNARARLLGMGASAAEVAALDKRAPGQPSRFVLRAPIAGTIIQQAASSGQAVGPLTAGVSTPLFTVSNLSEVWVTGALREEDAGKARVGQPFEARPNADPDRVIQGRIDYVAPVLDPATRRVIVRATVANPDGRLRPEMFLAFTLQVGATGKAPAVPAEAVIYEGDQAHVWSAEPVAHLLRFKAVKTGRSADGLVEILSGLAPGEQVVTKGALFVDQAAKAG